MSKRQILVFEDKGENFEKIEGPLTDDPRLDQYDIEWFPVDRTAPESWDGEEDPEPTDILYPYLENPHPDLVVLDWELGGYKSGVRRQHVQSACEELGIPLCVYHRDEGHFSDPESLKEYEENLIRIDVKETSEQVADAIATIATSFVEIKEALRTENVDGVQSALHQVIDVPPSAEAQLDQYSLGQSAALRVAKSDMTDEERTRITSTFIGYWIHNQILEYPGVLLNEVATASYLGVDHEEFQTRQACYEALEKAAYDGPFSDLSRDNWWWTNLLDEIRLELPPGEDGDLLSGPALFEELCGESVSPVTCVESGEPKAGYYCILTEKPVCEEHSEKPGGWIPVGASRSRISSSELEKVNAWMPS